MPRTKLTDRLLQNSNVQLAVIPDAAANVVVRPAGIHLVQKPQPLLYGRNGQPPGTRDPAWQTGTPAPTGFMPYRLGGEPQSRDDIGSHSGHFRSYPIVERALWRVHAQSISLT